MSQQQTNLIRNSHVTEDVITLDVMWEDISWQMFSSCGLTFFYVYYSQSCKAFKGFWDNFFMIIIIYFYNYHLLDKFSTTVRTWVKPQDTFSMLYLNQQYHPNFTTTFNFVTSKFSVHGTRHLCSTVRLSITWLSIS